jgi:ribonuclease-3
VVVPDAERGAALEARLGHRFRDAELLERALTHSSWANEHPPALHQEGLALLGDAALGLVVAEHFLAKDPAASVGDLTERRAALVSGERLAAWAVEAEVGRFLRLGRGEDQTGGRTRPSILATTLEALLGVVYLESGLPAVRRVVGRLAMW